MSAVKSSHVCLLRMNLVASGKVKDVYDAGDGLLRFHFSDRVSAYDVKFVEPIPKKGEILCKFAEFWFGELGVPSHFVRRVSDTDMLVRRMKMLPIECVARGYLYGSLYDRHLRGESGLRLDDERHAARLPEAIFDPTTKAEHDEPVTRDSAIRMGLVSAAQYDSLESMTLKIYGQMASVAERAGFVMADLKLEFGMLGGKIVLGDSIGPDEFRMWPSESYEPGRVQDAYDKQILRDWLAAGGHKDRFERERAAGEAPRPPMIPSEIIGTMTGRYVDAYERITGRPLDA